MFVFNMLPMLLVILSVSVLGLVRMPVESARMRPTRSTRGAIEVERKFEIQDLTQLRERVLADGGRALGEVSFSDAYFDTADCVLTRGDRWLRRRDDAWELKVPTNIEVRSGGERTVFEEICGEEAVGDHLSTLHPNRFGDGDLATVLLAAGCKPFAEFSTSRSKFWFDGCQIDVDVASFGYAVIEIEQLVDDESQVQQALAHIEQVADRIQALPLQTETGGKLETYIRRHAPNVLQQLVEAGILAAPTQNT